MSEPLAAFAKALAAFQSELPKVGKERTGGGGSKVYTYADLPSIVEVAFPLLTKNGLSFTGRPTVTDDGFVLAYALLHTEGHVEGGFYPLPDPSVNTPQQIGSAITYARRYALCAITGIAPQDEDDDAQAAVTATAPSNGQKWGGQKRQQREFADPHGKKAERLSTTPADDPFLTGPAPTDRDELINRIFAEARERKVYAKDAFADKYEGLHIKDGSTEQLQGFLTWLTTEAAAS